MRAICLTQTGTAEPSSTSRPQYPEDSESPACTSEEEDEKDVSNLKIGTRLYYCRLFSQVKGKGKRKGPKVFLCICSLIFTDTIHYTEISTQTTGLSLSAK